MKIELRFTNFIGHTYTLALARKVNIEKAMNISPKTGEAKRKIAQQAWLEKHSYEPDILDTLQASIDKECHWGTELTGQPIVVPGNRLMNALIDTFINYGKPLKLKMRQADLRTYLTISNLTTDRPKEDWTWTRCMLGRGADGKVQATAKRIATNHVIGAIPEWIKNDPEQEVLVVGKPEPFVAIGTVVIDEFAPEGFADSFWELLDYAGQHVGVGCSRDMGFGRFSRIGGKKFKATKTNVKLEQVGAEIDE